MPISPFYDPMKDEWAMQDDAPIMMRDTGFTEPPPTDLSKVKEYKEMEPTTGKPVNTLEFPPLELNYHHPKHPDSVLRKKDKFLGLDAEDEYQPPQVESESTETYPMPESTVLNEGMEAPIQAPIPPERAKKMDMLGMLRAKFGGQLDDSFRTQNQNMPTREDLRAAADSNATNRLLGGLAESEARIGNFQGKYDPSTLPKYVDEIIGDKDAEFSKRNDLVKLALNQQKAATDGMASLDKTEKLHRENNDDVEADDPASTYSKNMREALKAIGFDLPENVSAKAIKQSRIAEVAEKAYIKRMEIRAARDGLSLREREHENRRLYLEQRTQELERRGLLSRDRLDQDMENALRKDEFSNKTLEQRQKEFDASQSSKDRQFDEAQRLKDKQFNDAQKLKERELQLKATEGQANRATKSDIAAKKSTGKGASGKTLNGTDAFKQLPRDKQIMVEQLSRANGTKVVIANQVEGFLKQFDSAKSDNDRIVVGQQMIKLLNSTEGADAVGAEEARRLANELEAFTLKSPNGLPRIGVDLKGFRLRAMAVMTSVRNAIKSNQISIDQMMGTQQSAPTPGSSASPSGSGNPPVWKPKGRK